MLKFAEVTHGLCPKCGQDTPVAAPKAECIHCGRRVSNRGNWTNGRFFLFPRRGGPIQFTGTERAAINLARWAKASALRGLRSNIQGALNASTDGAYVQLDIKTARGIIDALCLAEQLLPPKLALKPEQLALPLALSEGA